MELTRNSELAMTWRRFETNGKTYGPEAASSYSSLPVDIFQSTEAESERARLLSLQDNTF